MSKYYKIKGLKVRVSDHEPNERLNGSNDIELYTKSVDGQKLNIRNQIKRILESKIGLENMLTMEDFNEVLGKKQNALTSCKLIVDLWFQNENSNSQLIADLKINLDAFVPSSLNAKQAEAWKAYVVSKF